MYCGDDMVRNVMEGSGLGSILVETGLVGIETRVTISIGLVSIRILPKPSLQWNASVFLIEDTHVKRLGLIWFPINIIVNAIYNLTIPITYTQYYSYVAKMTVRMIINLPKNLMGYAWEGKGKTGNEGFGRDRRGDRVVSRKNQRIILLGNNHPQGPIGSKRRVGPIQARLVIWVIRLNVTQEAQLCSAGGTTIPEEDAPGELDLTLTLGINKVMPGGLQVQKGGKERLPPIGARSPKQRTSRIYWSI